MSKPAPPAIHVVATSHGTDDPHGQELIHDLRAQLAQLAAQQIAGRLVWHEAYVDVQQPRLEEVLANLPHGAPAAVLPLLVSDGVHTTVDIARAVAARPNTVAADPLGPLPELAQLLARRASEHLERDPQVILAAAGTRLAVGQQQAADLARQIAELLGRDIALGYCAGAAPNISAVVEDAAKRPVLVLSSLLAEGYFQRKLASTGADIVTSPLLPDVTIAQCFLLRLKNVVERGDFMSPDDELLTR